ncbi:MAG TPA: glycosyltransferase, partial [Thermoanaerobaculia bacterium]|nr:glycosyltransferase [Thermoanaerobaculia bacterium]
MNAEVFLPTYNGARFLPEAIRSLPLDRLTVIDDASTDDTVAIARRIGAKVVENTTRAGLTGNWNRALRMATAEAFVIAHQDDVYDASFLDAMTALLASRPRAFAAHAKSRYIDERGAAIDSPAARYKERFWPGDEPYERDPADELRALQGGNYIIAPSVIFRTAAVREIGAFDESYQFVPDWDYWVRGLLAGFTIAGTHARLVSWRRHAETATAAQERSLARYEEEVRILASLAERAGFAPRFEAVENTLLSDFAARLAAGDRDGARALLRFA